MAFPTVSAPYGLEAVNSLDGKPYAGASAKFQLLLVSAPLFSMAIPFKSTLMVI
jgi:hypothetical protein